MSRQRAWMPSSMTTNSLFAKFVRVATSRKFCRFAAAAVEVVTPDEYMGDVMGDLSSRRGRIEGMEARGNTQVVRAQVPLGDCLVESAGTVIDGSLDKRWRRAIAALERDCGMALFERRGRGVVPTDAGHILARYVKRQQNIQESFFSEIDSLRKAERGHIDLVLGEGFVELMFDRGQHPVARRNRLVDEHAEQARRVVVRQGGELVLPVERRHGVEQRPEDVLRNGLGRDARLGEPPEHAGARLVALRQQAVHLQSRHHLASLHKITLTHQHILQAPGQPGGERNFSGFDAAIAADEAGVGGGILLGIPADKRQAGQAHGGQDSQSGFPADFHVGHCPTASLSAPLCPARKPSHL